MWRALHAAFLLRIAAICSCVFLGKEDNRHGGHDGVVDAFHPTIDGNIEPGPFHGNRINRGGGEHAATSGTRLTTSTPSTTQLPASLPTTGTPCRKPPTVISTVAGKTPTTCVPTKPSPLPSWAQKASATTKVESFRSADSKGSYTKEQTPTRPRLSRQAWSSWRLLTVR